MFCPRCGHFIGDIAARYCPNCGYEIGSYSTPLPMYRGASGSMHDPVRGKNKGSINGKIIAVCLISVIVLGTFICIIQIPEDNNIPDKVEIQTVTDDTFFELSGDFLTERGILAASLDDGRIAFKLSDELSSEYDYYTWTFFNADRVSSTNKQIYQEYKGDRISKAEPVLYFLSPNIGEYHITVYCYHTESDGQRVNSATYSGIVSYIGTVTKEYTWTYLNEEHTVQTTFGYEEYRKYRNMNADGRYVIDYRRVVSFVVYEDPVIESLAESLMKEYGGTDIDGQDFASFVLGFVQICFSYPPNSVLMDADKYQYGQDEYFAYPLETIFFGMGDCEDTSILATALFKAVGFDAAVVIIPGHAVAAVGLEQYSPEAHDASQYEILSNKIGEITYYGCETTVNVLQGIGLINLSGYNGLPYSSYIGQKGYGFYTV